MVVNYINCFSKHRSHSMTEVSTLPPGGRPRSSGHANHSPARTASRPNVSRENPTEGKYPAPPPPHPPPFPTAPSQKRVTKRNRCIIPNFDTPSGRFFYVHFSYVAIFVRFEILKVRIPNGSKLLMFKNS